MDGKQRWSEWYESNEYVIDAQKTKKKKNVKVQNKHKKTNVKKRIIVFFNVSFATFIVFMSSKKKKKKR